MPLSTKIVTPARTEEVEMYVSAVSGSDVGKDLGSKKNPFNDAQLALRIIGAKKGEEAGMTYRIGMGPGVSPGPYKLPGARRIVFYGWDGK